MIIVGLELFDVLIATAVTSGREKAMILKTEVSRMRLLMQYCTSWLSRSKVGKGICMYGYYLEEISN